MEGFEYFILDYPAKVTDLIANVRGIISPFLMVDDSQTVRSLVNLIYLTFQPDLQGVEQDNPPGVIRTE